MIPTILPTIVIENVLVGKLSARVEAYKTLFASTQSQPIVKVKGSLLDQQGELVFLKEFRLVDMGKLGRRWLWIQIDDGEWCRVRPLGTDFIDAVQISA